MNIAFPFSFDSRGRTASANDSDHIRQMIEQLIFTNPGERVNRPDFGSGVMQLIFAPNSPELAATVEFTLRSDLRRWLGDVIDVQSLDVQTSDSVLIVDLKYLVLLTSQQQAVRLTRNV